MPESPGFAHAAWLMADPARAMMLMALTDGRARPAGELARAAGITPQTASVHLARLHAGGLLAMETQGRHRYYRMAGDHVAQAVEQLAAIRPLPQPARTVVGRKGRLLRHCRTCYDHLAGRVGVLVTRALVDQGFLVAVADKRFEVSRSGATWFSALGIDVDTLRPTRRGIARQCLDSTEREHHLAGPLGRRLLESLCDRGWLRRSREPRVIQVTPAGRQALKRHLGVDPERAASVDGE
ncbi:hypothetical protein KBTX_01695 [wastewater metagenome]|uniref:HTH arsR-type domain-containing protein n=2 Tax=unclassified sequences TaxID=12908 RepID=A0A5B8RD07_9ZZZZ|nr:metalloregulator ArsR/SmtB family transcription factor [Arhodomonas sp. KWT]QEA05374.1 hypothetical protein KBTEX_01695 [uncultured organism]